MTHIKWQILKFKNEKPTSFKGGEGGERTKQNRRDSSNEQKDLLLTMETKSTVTSGRFQKTLIECYQKCCQYCSLYSLQSGKIAVSVQEPRKRTFLSSYPIWGGNSHRMGEEREGAGRKGREEELSFNEYLVGVLLKSWLVCSSIIFWIFYPSIPPRATTPAQRNRRRWRVMLVMVSCQRQLIGSSQTDPRFAPYLSCDLSSSMASLTCI